MKETHVHDGAFGECSMVHAVLHIAKENERLRDFIGAAPGLTGGLPDDDFAAAVKGKAPTLDPVRLGKAMEAATGVAWPKRWRDSDFAWIARQVAGEYEK